MMVEGKWIRPVIPNDSVNALAYVKAEMGSQTKSETFGAKMRVAFLIGIGFVPL